MSIIVINTEPIKEEHVTYYVKDEHKLEGINRVLYEIVKCTYNHPDAPEHAVIHVLEERRRKSVPFMARAAAPMTLLMSAEENMQMCYDLIPE